MKLYKLEASNFEAFFGTQEEPIETDLQPIKADITALALIDPVR